MVVVTLEELVSTLNECLELSQNSHLKLKNKGNTIHAKLTKINEEIQKYGRDLLKHQVNDPHLHQTVLDLMALLRNVKFLLSRLADAKFFVKARFGKRCGKVINELNNLSAVLGMGIAYMGAKDACKGVVNLGIVTGFPSFDVLDSDDGGDLALNADKHFFGHGVTQNYEAAFRLYMGSARLNYSRAQYVVGTMFLTGLGTSKNEKEGVKWILRAAAQSYPDAVNHVGLLYESGDTILEKDILKAYSFFKRAMELEHLDGMTNLANLILSNPDVDRTEDNVRDALKTLRDAEEKGYAKAQNLLGHLYYTGSFVKRDYDKAVELFRKSAEQGNVFAQNNLGICYEEGHGVVKDYATATTYYDRSSKAGNVSAMNNLGYIKMLQRQFDQAKNLLHDAADRGSVDALYNLATMYDRGFGDMANIHLAVSYYTKASDLNHSKAQKRLGDIYYSGAEGIPIDHGKALQYYFSSALQGNADAQNNLGIMHEEGIGVEQSDEEAVRWYSDAAQQCHMDACFNLALMYEEGKGVERSAMEAMDLYRVAADKGHKAALDRIMMVRQSQKLDNKKKDLMKSSTLHMPLYRSRSKVHFNDNDSESSDVVVLESSDSMIRLRSKTPTPSTPVIVSPKKTSPTDMVQSALNALGTSVEIKSS